LASCALAASLIVIASLSAGCANGAEGAAVAAGGGVSWPTPRSADTGFTGTTGSRDSPRSDVRPTQGVVVLTPLHVRIPANRAQEAEALWNHMQEQVLDAGATLRLRRNGLRVGVSHSRFWDAVRAAVEAIDGRLVSNYDAFILPRGVPLFIDLDSSPHAQTLFAIDPDGNLSGTTLPPGRNRLRLTYTIDTRGDGGVFLSLVPEVAQRLEGTAWLDTAVGGQLRSSEKVTTFSAAAVTARLRDGEFLVVAPAEASPQTGLVGGAFFAEEINGQRYLSYVFLRPDLTRVGERRL
jgi:hypothetical protein